jgi:hypothetical protein
MRRRSTHRTLALAGLVILIVTAAAALTHRSPAASALSAAPPVRTGEFGALQPPPLAAAPADLTVPALAADQLGQWCLDRRAAGVGDLPHRARAWLDDCAAMFGPGNKPSPKPKPTKTPSPSPSPSPTPSPIPTPSASPTPSPSPSALTNCMPLPSRCGYPDATNTGVASGSALTVISGDMTISTPGTVIDGKDIRGCVLVTAANVTIRRSKVSCTAGYVVLQQITTGTLTVEDSELTCLGASGTAMGYNNFVARRLNIYGCENGFDVDNNAVIIDNWIHITAPDHSDGVQLNAGSRITIQHNTITNTVGTSAIIAHPDGNSDVLVQDNLMAGGAYTLYCPEERSTNFRVIGNRFSAIFYSTVGAYGPWVYCEMVTVLSGNVYDADLQPL